MSFQTHELPEHEEPNKPPAPPQVLRVHRGDVNARGLWMIADVHLTMQLGTDRAGNAQLILSVQLQRGTEAGTRKDADGKAYRTRLAEPVTVPVYLDPYSLAHLAWRTLGNSGGKATSGALRAKRGTGRLSLTAAEPITVYERGTE